MIICDDREFAFIHIPKCAGTSIRRALRKVDTTGEAFSRIIDHPVMGLIHSAHLTLAELAEHYPDTFAKVAQYRSMAVVRDPVDRFYSAIFQRLREFKEIPQSAISSDTIETEADAVIAYLQSWPARMNLKHVHFHRQCDFIELDNKPVVTEIFPVTHMERAAEHIRRMTGVEIGGERRNRTTQLRFAALRPVQRALRDRYAKLVSAKRRASIREKMVRAGLYMDVPKDALVRPGGHIEHFVQDYYARDFEIFAACERQFESQAA